MLWSLTKILLFVLIVVSLTFGATMLIENGEPIRITIASTEYTLSPLVAAVAALVLLGLTWLVFRVAGFLLAVLKFINGDETAISRYFSRNRERKGYKALADGMMALASGEGRLAMTKAAQAERYLGRPELTTLLAAQAAESVGDKGRATDAYKKLLADDRTRFVGVRGLLKQKLAEGDTDTALKLAEKAFSLKPKHAETQDTLLQLQAREEDWTGARKTLAKKLKTGGLPRDVHKRRDSVLAYCEAHDAEEGGDTDKAAALALEANRLAPTLIPAAAMAARMYIAAGRPRYATKAIKKAWESEPHPELAAAFAEIVPDESPAARIRRFEALVKLRPHHTETKLMMTELYIAAEDFPSARKALGDLPETDPTARSLTLMAAIERGSGADDAIVRGFLARAVTASRGPQWTCENCHNIHASWVPVCATCSGFDTLSWVTPPEPVATLANSAEMLPLIVGALEDHSDEPETADSEVVVDITPAVVEDSDAPTAPDSDEPEETPEAPPEPEEDEPVQNRASA